jgi:ATP-binding cassette, subfamily F, member 3
MHELELRGLLGCFLFSGDDADKKIKILSGGEKARVALAKVIVSKANFLMLDEPTNHLDMHSCDLLIEALNKYEGSIILVSHDRYFVAKTANKIWEIVDHEIKEFKGGYEEWVAWKERMAKQEADLKKAQGNSNKQQASVIASGAKQKEQEIKKAAPPVQKPANTAIDKEAKKELQRVQKQFQQLEEKIATLNKQKNELEASLSDPAIYSDKTKFLQAETAYKKAGDELAQLNTEYEKVFEKIMEMEGK